MSRTTCLPPGSSVVVLVLGDLIRSPRMLYHARSVVQARTETLYNSDANVEAEVEVTLIGMINTPIDMQTKKWISGEDMRSATRVKYKNIPTMMSAKWHEKWRWIALALKVIYQLVALIWILISNRIDVVLMQTPPAIPTMVALLIAKTIKRYSVIVDWHNLGYTLLALKYGKNHPIVTIHQYYERISGALLGDAHLCVTQAMAEHLKTWGITATVLYDKPPEHFSRLEKADRHALWMRLESESGVLPKQLRHFFGIDDNRGSLITDSNGCFRQRRPAILVSSTSWTQDEDFSILLDALIKYDSSCDTDGFLQLPSLLCIITGKGPMKQSFEQMVAQKRFKHVAILTAFLSTEEYPLLLGSADLGISLHKSSSNLDLPMKIVDMFGCSLPVLAIGFECLNELVDDGRTGLVFNDTDDLVRKLQQVLSSPKNADDDFKAIATMRTHINSKHGHCSRWSANWENIVLPMLITTILALKSRRLLSSLTATVAPTVVILAIAIIVHMMR